MRSADDLKAHFLKAQVFIMSSVVQPRRWSNKVDDPLLAQLFKEGKLNPKHTDLNSIKKALKFFPHCSYNNFAPLYKNKCSKWILEKTLSGKRRGPDKGTAQQGGWKKKEDKKVTIEDFLHDNGEGDEDYIPQEEEVEESEEVAEEVAEEPEPPVEEDPIVDITKSVKKMSVSKSKSFSMSWQHPYIMWDYNESERRHCSIDFYIPASSAKMVKLKVSKDGKDLYMGLGVPRAFANKNRLLLAEQEGDVQFNEDTHKATAFHDVAEEIEKEFEKDEDDDVNIILLGPTQAGKSTFIRTLLPEDYPNPPAVGRQGVGRSVTDACQLYDTELGLVLDSPGYNDTDREIRIKEFTNQSASLLDRCNGVRFVVFDSMSNDAICLRSTMEVLTNAFGNHIGNSVVVVGTKKDRLDEDELEERLENMKEILQFLNLPDCAIIPWSSKRVSSEEMDHQKDEVANALDAVESTNLSKPEIARGDHLAVRFGPTLGNSTLHAIVLAAYYSGREARWKIIVATLSTLGETPALVTREVTSTELKDNKVSVGGDLTEAKREEEAARRAEYLYEHPDLVRFSPTLCASECFASWCRVGKWQPCSISGNFSAANPLNNGIPGAVATGVAYVAGGIAGMLGETVMMSLAPILVPAVLATTYCQHKNIWTEHESRLNKAYNEHMMSAED